jgi:hypothetical protein
MQFALAFGHETELRGVSLELRFHFPKVTVPIMQGVGVLVIA